MERKITFERFASDVPLLAATKDIWAVTALMRDVDVGENEHWHVEKIALKRWAERSSARQALALASKFVGPLLCEPSRCLWTIADCSLSGWCVTAAVPGQQSGGCPRHRRHAAPDRHAVHAPADAA